MSDPNLAAQIQLSQLNAVKVNPQMP